MHKVTLNLIQKAIILVVVPLTFELVLLTTLYSLLREAEVAAAKADHAKAVIAKSSDVIENLFNAGIGFIEYDAQTKPLIERRFNDVMRKIPLGLNTLTDLVQDNPNHLRIATQVRKEFNDSAHLLLSHKREVDAGERLNIVIALQLRRNLEHMVNELNKIIESEKAARIDPHKANRLRLLVNQLLIFGIVSSILIAFFLVWVFHKGTTRRLATLMTNSQRIGTMSSPLPLLEGNDEIAQLDRVLHEASDILAEAARKEKEIMEFRRNLTAMISHDLRTPLAAVQSTLALVERGAWGALSDKGKTKVSNATTNIDTSIGLINNLLDLEKMDAGKLNANLKPVSVRGLLLRCADALSMLAERKNVLITLPENDATVLADEDLLGQVISNLIGNAIKFSPEDTTIDLLIESETGIVTTSVRDFGCGIPEEHLDSVFERYHQVPTEESKRTGSGLGLTICKAFIEAQNGSIGVSSKINEGSTFWFRLNSAPADEAA